MDYLPLFVDVRGAPCLVVGGKPLHESGDIISYLAGRATDLAV